MRLECEQTGTYRIAHLISRKTRWVNLIHVDLLETHADDCVGCTEGGNEVDVVAGHAVHEALFPSKQRIVARNIKLNFIAKRLEKKTQQSNAITYWMMHAEDYLRTRILH